jgi:hypothetical protein
MAYRWFLVPAPFRADTEHRVVREAVRIAQQLR